MQLRYKPSPNGPNVKIIGGVDEYDIYVSNSGNTYVVRWSNSDFVRFYVRCGIPTADEVEDRLGDRDVAERIHQILDLFAPRYAASITTEGD